MMDRMLFVRIALAYHLVKHLIKRLVDITVPKSLCLLAKSLKIGAREPGGEESYWIGNLGTVS
jgi:hypothetical protein